MTVAKLREKCKALGLPQYQHKGKRLLKADLERQLKEHAERMAKATPIFATPFDVVDCDFRSDDEQLVEAMAALSPCQQYARVLAKYLRVGDGRITQHERAVLNGRSAQACVLKAKWDEPNAAKWLQRALVYQGCVAN